MKIFVEYLSPDFEEMNFAEIARICFTKFKILLVAIERKSDSHIVINPKPDLKIASNTKAFFIADDKDSVKRFVLLKDRFNEFFAISVAVI